MKTITVRFEYEFEFDAEGYDPNMVDILALAKDSALKDMVEAIEYGYITQDDFEVV